MNTNTPWGKNSSETERRKKEVKTGFCIITKAMLSLQHDQVITDRIERNSLSHHFQGECQAGDLS